MNPAKWEFWIERGGTYTDVVGRSPAGIPHECRLLTDNPDAYDDAALQGIRDILGLRPGDPLPCYAIKSVTIDSAIVALGTSPDPEANYTAALGR